MSGRVTKERVFHIADEAGVLASEVEQFIKGYLDRIEVTGRRRPARESFGTEPGSVSDYSSASRPGPR